jgi:hypothetical protein
MAVLSKGGIPSSSATVRRLISTWDPDPPDARGDVSTAAGVSPMPAAALGVRVSSLRRLHATSCWAQLVAGPPGRLFRPQKRVTFPVPR